ncbi:MAG: tyrosine-type recombinase/integrase, partial [Candidatus Diapherotrites archaeon]|nr:tyrosine-type recombinase/integrase [Candidatus Diapherotrites archaeon]
MPEDYTANSNNAEVQENEKKSAPQETAEQGAAAQQKNSERNDENAAPQNKNEKPAESAPQKGREKPAERAPLSSENSALVEKFRQELLISGYSSRTLTMYLSYVSDFLGFIKKRAPLAAREDLVSYMAMLKEKRAVSNATLALALASLKFFFHTFLRMKIVDEIKIPKKARKLPVVLTKDEVKGLIKATKAGRNRLVVEFIYSTGARVSEATNIKVNDLELREGIGVVRGGKGKKDRIIILSKNWISEVKRYLKHKRA